MPHLVVFNENLENTGQCNKSNSVHFTLLNNVDFFFTFFLLLLTLKPNLFFEKWWILVVCVL